MALPIFPGRHQPSIVGRNELNYRVRNGNGWTLVLISTNYRYPVFPENKHTIHFSLALVKLLCKSNISCLICGDPYRIRTDVNGVRGRCLNHLTNGPCRRKKLRSIPFGFRQSSQRSVLPPLSSVNASLVCVGCLLSPHPRCTRFEYTSNRLGAPSRTRTGDPLIKSQLLYQLS